MRTAWAFVTIALFAAFLEGFFEPDNAGSSATKHSVSKQKVDVQYDQIITGSLRGSSVIHPVSNAQMLKLASADVSTTASFNQSELVKKIEQLNEIGSLKAKCFRVKINADNQRAALKWRKIDYELVDRYIDLGSPEGTPMSREKIMADIWLVREAALQSEGTPQRFRTFGLYILQVQDTLIKAHQYYGERGFKWAQKLVLTEYDYELAEHIRDILPSKFYTHRLNQNMQLFTRDLKAFIPCSIRAKRILTQGGSSS